MSQKCRFAERNLWNAVEAISSIHAHAARLNWLRPFRNLSRDKLGKIFGHPFLGSGMANGV
jgi:hypothetical protein